MREVRPYPWSSLPSWRRAERATVRAFARRIGPSAPFADLAPRWNALLGPLSASPHAPFALTRAAALQAHEGASLAAVVRHPVHGLAALLIDRPAALSLAARCLGADAPAAARAADANVFSQAHEGALTALAARALSLACAPSPAPVVRAITDRVTDALDALAPGDLVAWPWWIATRDGAFWLTLLAPAQALVIPATPAPPDLARVGDIAVRFSVLAARAPMPLREIDALRRGDALLFDSVHARGGALAGEVTVALGELELPCSIAGPRTLTLRAPAQTTKEPMSIDDPATDATAVRTEALAAIPVDVSIEVARGELAVSEVAALRVGEVLTLGTPLGERVTVRAGGRAIARGELVEVEGEVGVRLTEIL